MSNASLATSPAAEHPSLSPHVLQALNMLDLDPDQELERYRQYKNLGSQPEPKGDAAELSTENSLNSSHLVVNMTEDEDEDEEYEVIPPSQPFAVYQEITQRKSSQPVDYVPAGEMILTGELQEDASLDLSFVPPGEMAAARDEYLPASQELWRSLGQPQAPTPEQPLPKWQLPLAIGSTLMAIAAVGGMSYVNIHSELLKTVPGVAQLTAPAALPAIPPGQALQGPDLAMGEFSELTLSNINGIALPDTEAKLAAAAMPVAPNSVATNPTASPVGDPAMVPGTPALTLPSTGTSERLADGLMRNLLPPNIQQLAGQPQAPVSSIAPTQPQVKPYTPNQLYYYQPPMGVIRQPSYSVTTNYVNPLGFAKVQSLIPGATMKDGQIDLGSFARKSAAIATVKKLQQEGVNAWITQQP